MKKSILSSTFIAFSLSLLSCGKLERPTQISLSYEQNGTIAQAGLTEAAHHRYFFSYGKKDAGFEGVQEVESFSKVNQHSLPDEVKSRYWGVVFTDKDNKNLYDTLLDKSYYYQQLDDAPEYYLVNYRGTFFVDIPATINLTETTQVYLVDLNSNNIVGNFPIDDIEKKYSNPFSFEEGWNGEKKVYRVFGNKDSAQAFDFVVLTEGFTEDELSMGTLEDLMDSKFGKYLNSYILPLLDTEPYKSIKENINLWVVATPSLESGVSNPFQNKKRLTTYRATFGAHCTERSLVVRDQKRALEMASLTPFDQAIVLVNDETYGGQGSDIATFSVHSAAPYLIKHELAHAVGLLADEYKYFSDTRAHGNCEDNLIESYATHMRKNWGRNQFSENQNELAPNLSGNSDSTKVKWAHLLKEDSPIIHFDYPESDSMVNDDFTITANFEASFDREDLYITMGVTKELNLYLPFVDQILINEGAVSFEKYQHLNSQIFLKVNDFKITKGDPIKLQLKFSQLTSEQFKYLSYYSASYHFLTLPSGVFKGTADEIGIFQGSNVDAHRTYRSSYQNIMSSSSVMDFDKWQEYAYKSIIEYFIQAHP